MSLQTYQKAHASHLRSKYGIASPMAPSQPAVDAEEARRAKEAVKGYLPLPDEFKPIPFLLPSKSRRPSVH
jgi:hypothetical protein